MLKGRYRDVVTGPTGARLAATDWRSNLIVDGAFTLLATLLKRDPDAKGILYWAVGAGRASWDDGRPDPMPWTSSLAAEVGRLEVPVEAIGYVDERGASVDSPSPNLHLQLVFAWPEEQVTLREFGLFGGDATGQAGTGGMINHVVHERIDLQPGQRLTRELRLSFARSAGRRWLEVPQHRLADADVRVVEGVGARYAGALTAKSVATVGALADADLDAAEQILPRVQLIEFRAKARLALQTAVELDPPPGLYDLTVSQLLSTAAADVATGSGVLEAEVVRLREQLSTLELALDHRFLGRTTVRSLVEGGS